MVYKLSQPFVKYKIASHAIPPKKKNTKGVKIPYSTAMNIPAIKQKSATCYSIFCENNTKVGIFVLSYYHVLAHY